MPNNTIASPPSAPIKAAQPGQSPAFSQARPLQSVRDAEKTKQNFEVTLQRVAQSDGNMREVNEKSAQHPTGLPDYQAGEGSEQSGSEGGFDDKEGAFFAENAVDIPIGAPLTQPATPALSAVNFAAFASAPAGQDQAQAAALQRMAAAIAEVAQTGSDPKMTVQFGKMAGFAESAIIGRDATGALSIHIITVPGILSDARSTLLSAQLHDRLMRRKLKISSVDFIPERTLTENAISQKG